jgi:hypothetical protein
MRVGCVRAVLRSIMLRVVRSMVRRLVCDMMLIICMVIRLLLHNTLLVRQFFSPGPPDGAENSSARLLRFHTREPLMLLFRDGWSFISFGL